jgi:glyoxylase-like metal-dependent hydrolase (beta-lactamase superfamily II)
MRIGEFDLTPLSDGTTWWDGGGAFGLVPKVRWERLLPPDEQNRIPMILRCLLVRTPQATVLVDAGMGDKVTPEMTEHQSFRLERPHGWLLDDLARHGVSPEDIDIVVLSHLHSDHCGASTRILDGQLAPTFPRAQYWVQQREWDDAHHPNERTRATYHPANMDPILASGQLRLVNGNVSVTRGVRVEVAPGHTAGMQAIVIESGGQTAVFPSDLAFFRWHLERLAWVSAYDLDPMTTIETKRRWQRWLAEREAIIVFQHDPMPLGRLVQQDGRYTVVPYTDTGIETQPPRP